MAAPHRSSSTSRRLLAILKPTYYNAPTSWQMLWNQWVHWGYVRGWYSYETHARHLRELP